MANSTSIKIVQDGPRNVIVKFEGVLDTSDLTSTTVLDPALLADMDIWGIKATKLRIQKIQYSIEDTLSVNLFWDATTPIRIEELVGRGKMEYYKFGGLAPLPSESGSAGWTGKITATTQGWAASGVLSFSIILECVKG
jgi:hypothetical protein